MAFAETHAESSDADAFHWTARKVVLSVFLFLLAGLCEIGGGWATWQGVRGRFAPANLRWRSPSTFLLLIIGACALSGYGFVVTAQPPPSFGRLYAVYGGFFVVLSYLWGWLIDHDKPDRGDVIGATIAIAGVAVAWFWPR